MPVEKKSFGASIDLPACGKKFCFSGGLVLLGFANGQTMCWWISCHENKANGNIHKDTGWAADLMDELYVDLHLVLWTLAGWPLLT